MSVKEPTPCTVCYGSGQAALFTSLVECPSCDGLGWWLPDDYKEFFGELAENIYGNKIVIGMGAGSISNWIRDLPNNLK